MKLGEGPAHRQSAKEEAPMPQPPCRHAIDCVNVEHRPGYVNAQCLSCGALLSSWFGDEWRSEAVELVGVMNEIKDHLYHLHQVDDWSGCEALRTCAWDGARYGRFAGV
jgi:hypothetical protein